MAERQMVVIGSRRATALMVLGAVTVLVLGTAGGAVGAQFVTSDHIKDGTIKGVDIRNRTITGAKIKDGSLTGKDVKDRSLTGKDVKDKSLTGTDVKDSSLTGADVKNGSLTGADVKDESLTGSDILNRSLTGADIKAGAITGEHLAEGSVTVADLAPAARSHWAEVRHTGVRLQSTEGVSSAKVNVGLGFYKVTFPIDVSKCVVIAGLRYDENAPGTTGGTTTSRHHEDPSSIYVQTYNATGGEADRGFSVLVSC